MSATKIGEDIRKKRRELNLSQKKLGDAVGITKQAIWTFEANRHIPGSIKTMLALERALGFEVGYLYKKAFSDAEQQEV